jgi:hypothetical protein
LEPPIKPISNELLVVTNMSSHVGTGGTRAYSVMLAGWLAVVATLSISLPKKARIVRELPSKSPNTWRFPASKRVA